MHVSKLKFTEVLCSSSGFQHDNNAKKLFGTSLNLSVSLGSTPGNIEILASGNKTGPARVQSLESAHEPFLKHRHVKRA